jgi:hypothetical protein
VSPAYTSLLGPSTGGIVLCANNSAIIFVSNVIASLYALRGDVMKRDILLVHVEVKLYSYNFYSFVFFLFYLSFFIFYFFHICFMSFHNEL